MGGRGAFGGTTALTSARGATAAGRLRVSQAGHMAAREAVKVTSEQRVQRSVLTALALYAALLAACVLGFRALGLETELDDRVLAAAQHRPWGWHWRDVLGPGAVQQAHSSAATAFAITAGLTYQVWRWSHHPTKRSVSLLVCAVNSVAAANYSTKLLGLQPPLKATFGGYGWFPATQGVIVYGPLRYLEWAFTTSFLIMVVACLTPDGPRAQRLVRTTVLYNVLVILSGGLEHWVSAAASGGVGDGAQLHQGVSSSLFLVACCLFVPVMRGQAALYALAGDTLSTPKDAAGLGSLYRTTVLTWCLFPVFRAACLAGLLGPCTQEAAFVFLDLASKMGFSVYTLVGTFTLAGGA